jgi:hypothetical protein
LASPPPCLQFFFLACAPASLLPSPLIFRGKFRDHVWVH